MRRRLPIGPQPRGNVLAVAARLLVLGTVAKRRRELLRGQLPCVDVDLETRHHGRRYHPSYPPKHHAAPCATAAVPKHCCCCDAARSSGQLWRRQVFTVAPSLLKLAAVAKPQRSRRVLFGQRHDRRGRSFRRGIQTVAISERIANIIQIERRSEKKAQKG